MTKHPPSPTRNSLNIRLDRDAEEALLAFAARERRSLSQAVNMCIVAQLLGSGGDPEHRGRSARK
jgi:hypothetical protein